MDAALVAVLAGVIGVPLVNLIKARLGWSGPKVQLLAAVVAGGLAIGGLFATGQLLPVTLDNIASRVALAFAVSQAVYALLPKA